MTPSRMPRRRRVALLAALVLMAVVAAIAAAPAGAAPIRTVATLAGAPTDVVAVPGDTVAELSWTAPASDGGSTITGYRVVVYLGGVAFGLPIDLGVVTSVEIGDLTNGLTYTFTVAATNGAGTGPESAMSGPTTPIGPPGPPASVTVTAGPAAAFVSWTVPPADGGSPITGYRVLPELDGVEQAVQTFTSTATTQLITGLTVGGSYRFRVATISALGAGGLSDRSAVVVVKAAWAPFTSWSALVTQLYTDLLGRSPTSTELSSRVTALNAKTLTPGGLVASLRGSTDHVTDVDPVTRLYRAYFLRIPDQPGLTFWIGKKRTGSTLNSISSTFAASAEFKTRYGTLTNQQFVELVYTNVLGRPGDASGIAYWTGQLNTGTKTRGQVMVGFSESTEFKTKQVNKVTVAVLYILLLRRAPTTLEFTTQTAALAGATKSVSRLATELLATTTFANRFP